MAEAPLLKTLVKVLIFRTGIYCKLFGHKMRELSPHPYLFNCIWSDLTLVDHWVVHSLSCVQLFATPWTAACQASLSFTISWSLFRLMSIKSVILSNHLILCCLLLQASIFPRPGLFPMSQLFKSDGQSIRASASSSVLPMNVYGWCRLGFTALISFLSKGLSRVFSSTTVWKH